MSLLITICARGGSKGVPRKNIRNLAGEPLISYTIRCAQQVAKRFPGAKVALSSEDQEILDLCAEQGLKTEYVRPLHLATDQTGKVEVLHDLLSYEEERVGVKYEILLDLDVTSPLRSISDLLMGFEMFLADPMLLTLMSVSHAGRNPYFNMLEKDDSGYYNLVKQVTKNHMTRQSAPEVYDINGSFYFYRRRFFEQGLKSCITSKTGVFLMDHRCFDIDYEDDLVLMEQLIKENKLSFDLP